MTRQDLVNMITAIDQAILDSVTGGVSSFAVQGGTSYVNLSLKELRDMRAEYSMMLFRYDNSADGTTVRQFPQWINPANANPGT